MSKSPLAKFNQCNHEGHTPSLCPQLGVETVEETPAMDENLRLRRIEALLVEMLTLQKETIDKVDDIQDDVDEMMGDLGFDDESVDAEVQGGL